MQIFVQYPMELQEIVEKLPQQMHMVDLQFATSGECRLRMEVSDCERTQFVPQERLLLVPNNGRGLRPALRRAIRSVCNFTYIIECEDGTLYTGWTNDLQKRLLAHQAGKGAKYTKAHRAKRFVYYRCFLTSSEAMHHEAEIKKMSKKQKLSLIQGWTSRAK